MTQQNHGHARTPYPLEVRRDTHARNVGVTWSDGHESSYPYAYLRGWCPCAGCQGHGGDKRYVHAAETELDGIEPVGKYALQFQWSDGHQTGIYSYRYLRELCPCPECGPG